MPDDFAERIARAKAILGAVDLGPIVELIDDDPNNHKLVPVAVAIAAIDSALDVLDGREPDLPDWHPIMEKLGRGPDVAPIRPDLRERIARAMESKAKSEAEWAEDPVAQETFRECVRIARETSPWIAVEDGLPATADDVYVLWANGCTSVASYRYANPEKLESERFWEDQHTSHDDSTVTHWFPLPDPPSEPDHA